jgi:hypothetical protein
LIEDRAHRATERLNADRPSSSARKLLLSGIEDVKQGRQPRHRISDPQANQFPHLMVVSEVIPGSMHWKDYATKLVEKRQSSKQRDE